MSNFSKALLKKQFKDINKASDLGLSVGLVDENNFYKWSVVIFGPTETIYEGGFFRSILTFHEDSPNSPTQMQFTTKMWHPNIYKDGKVCISILHPPGTDKFNEQEKAEERWRPSLGAEEILLSVISMLNDPNPDSPANIDAAVMFRKNREEYNNKVRSLVFQTMEDF